MQVSGGRDSIACFYLLRPYLDRITVYFVNTGDAFPETLDTIRKMREIAPNFVEIDGNQPGVIEQFGIPSDIVPVSRTPIGIIATWNDLPSIQDRYTCCMRTIMLPLHDRMVADGITLIIRGQKASDSHKAPINSGHVENGVEYLFPIDSWSTQDVMDYLRNECAPIPRFYEMLDGAADCMTCSAWWEKGAAKYLKRYHQDAYVEVQRRLDIINQAVSGHIAHFNEEVL